MGNMYTTTGWGASIRNFVLPYALPFAMKQAREDPIKPGE